MTYPLNAIPYPTTILNNERVLLRRLDSADPQELARLKAIENHEEVSRFMIGQMRTIAQFRWFAKGDSHHITFALSGKAGHVDPVEVGQLQGWIHVYNDADLRRKLQKQYGKSLLEVSFAKYPPAKNGQVSSGLRQVCQWLHEQISDPALKIVAFAAPSNEASIRVLTAAGFKKQAETIDANNDQQPDLVFIL